MDLTSERAWKGEESICFKSLVPFVVLIARPLGRNIYQI